MSSSQTGDRRNGFLHGGEFPQTLVHLLHSRAIEQPEHVFNYFLADGEQISDWRSFGRLDQNARAIASVLSAQGAKGKRAILFYPAGLEFLDAFFGCLYAGVVAVPAFPPDPSRPDQILTRLQALAYDSQASLLLTTAAVQGIFITAAQKVPVLDRLGWLATDTIPQDAAGRWEPTMPDPEDMAYLQYTSGSTKQPRGVALNNRNLAHNSARISQCFRVTRDDVACIWLPMYHNLGLIGGLIQPLFLGCVSYQIPPQVFLQNPLSWLKLITRYQVTVAGGPNFGYDLCATRIPPEQRAGLNLSSWDLAFNGAEAVRPETLNRFSKTFEPYGFKRSAFYPCYGLAEATLMVTGGERAQGPVIQWMDKSALEQNKAAIRPANSPTAQALVGCGRSLVDQELLIVDPESREPLPERQIGEIWMRGPSIAAGYWNKPEETAETFQGFLASGAGPYLRTGDLGFLHEQECYITGRLKELIIIRGRNLYPQDIEQSVALSHPALVPGGAAAFAIQAGGEEKLAIVQEVRPQPELPLQEIAAKMRQAVSESHHVLLHAIVLVEPGGVARTISGKIQRSLMRKQFLSGELRALHTSTLEAPAQPANQRKAPGGAATDGSLLHAALLALGPDKAQGLLENYLAQQVAQELQVPAASLDMHAPLTSFGLDSINSIELTASIQESLGVKIAIEQIIQGASIAEIAQAALQQLFTQQEAAQGENPAAASTPAQAAAVPAAAATAEPTPAGAEEETFTDHPLSYGQRALWFVQRLQPESIAHNIVYALTFRSELNLPVMRRALQKLTLRHAVLRTLFLDQDGQPVQRVFSGPDHFDFTVEDGQDWDEAAVDARLNREVETPFDLQTGPLVRATFIRRPQGSTVVALALHHIITDLWSMVMLYHDLMELYTAELQGRQPALKPVEVAFTDTVRWQAEMLAGPQADAHLAYWKERLAGELPALNLPTDHPRTGETSALAGSCTLRLSPELAAALKELSAREGANLFSTLLAAFYTVLYRYTGQSDLLVGTPKAGRNRRNALVAGYFINPVILRAQVSGEMTFRDLLGQVYQNVQADFQHDEYPFPLLVERLHPTRSSGSNPLLQIFYTWQKTNQMMGRSQLSALTLNDRRVPFEANGLALETRPISARVSPTDLALLVAEGDDSLGLTIEYATGLFEQETIRRMLGHLHTLLQAVTANPGLTIATAPLLTQAERRQILREWNQAAFEAHNEPELPMHAWIEQAARLNPDHTALELGEVKVTYRELITKSRALAAQLVNLGAGPGRIVGLCVERSPEQVIGLLAILQAGSAYLPLDPEFPADRLAYMLTDSGAAAVLTQSWLTGVLPELNIPRLCLDVEISDCMLAEGTQPASVSPEDVAYIMYTSGSTGQPKGVLIQHRAITHHCRQMLRYYEVTPADRYLQFSSLNFDASLEQTFTALMSGATLVLRGREVTNPELFSQEIARRGLTVVNVPPAYWSQWAAFEAKAAQPPANPQLRLVIIGGDVMLPETLRQWQSTALGKVRLINAYGPTETTITATACEVNEQDLNAGPLPIGRPVAGRAAYILDANGQPVPAGVPGELLIGGKCLAKGYWNQPELTREKFIASPIPADERPADCDRLYRTGDLARYRRDGQIEFLGRVDRQIKVLGIRIEPGEIEAALVRHPAVADAVVIQAGQPAARLVACLKAQGEDKPGVEELAAFAARSLPRHMIPADFAFFDTFPLTPSGKLDRAALAREYEQRLADQPAESGGYVAPRDEMEEYLAGLWAQMLGVSRVGVHDNFFALGGHSLLAIQVMARVQERYRVEVPLRKLFETPTVANLAAEILNALAEQEDEGELERLLAELEDEAED